VFPSYILSGVSRGSFDGKAGCQWIWSDDIRRFVTGMTHACIADKVIVGSSLLTPSTGKKM
jgi:hypothetical protein